MSDFVAAAGFARLGRPDIFRRMPDRSDRTARKNAAGAVTAPTPADADLAAARIRAQSTEIRGCAILGPAGILAATGDGATWARAAAGLLEAADRAAGGSASHGHVATEEGEAYTVRRAGLAMVAVTDRFTLASLVLADMRATLRDLSRSATEEAVPEAA